MSFFSEEEKKRPKDKEEKANSKEKCFLGSCLVHKIYIILSTILGLYHALISKCYVHLDHSNT